MSQQNASPKQKSAYDHFLQLVPGGLSCMITSFQAESACDGSTFLVALSLVLMIFSTTVFNPMDTIKTKLQLQNQLSLVSSAQRKYHGFFHAVGVIWKEEGVVGYYRGITASMMRELSYSSLRMGLYEPARHFIVGDETKSGHDIKLWQKIAAGLISGAIGSSIANPTDLVKIRFQSWMPGQPRPYRHTMHAFWQIWRDSGIAGLYRGVVATATRAAVLTSAQLSSYDETKWIMRSWGFQDGYAVHLTAAVVAGLVTTTATSPVDVIKTRVMNDKDGVYKGSLDCFLKTLKSEGVRGMCTLILGAKLPTQVSILKFYLFHEVRGWVPNYLRLGPHFIISLPLFEYFRHILGLGYLK